MKCVHCPECGAKTERREIGDEGDVDYCAACDAPRFDLASPGVLVLAIDAECRLVLLRQHAISTTHWVLVAGFNKVGETAEETVRREVAEETGLRVESCRYVASYFHQGKQALLLGFLTRVTGELSRDSAEVEDLTRVAFDDAEALLRPGSIGLRLYRDARAVPGLVS